MNVTQSCNADSPSIVSGLRSMMYSPFAILIAWLLALANPKFSLFSMKVTCGNLSLRKAMESSLLLLSATMISCEMPSPAFSMERMHCQGKI
jgi:hypothetical protein